jgi:hypothetical protein
MNIAQANKRLKKATNKIANGVEEIFKVYLAVGYTHEEAQRQVISVLRSWEDELKHG